jgi:hypothetical protein
MTTGRPLHRITVAVVSSDRRLWKSSSSSISA